MAKERRVPSLVKTIPGEIDGNIIAWQVTHEKIVVNPGKLVKSGSETIFVDGRRREIVSPWVKDVGIKPGKYVPDEDFVCEGGYTDGWIRDGDGTLIVICANCYLFIADPKN